MNRSYSKIRHIQEVNQRLENRLLNEQINKTTNVPAGTTGTSSTTGTSGTSGSTAKPIGTCTGNNLIDGPLVTLGGKIGEGIFELKMCFKSTGTSDADFKVGFTALKNKIMDNLDQANYTIKINKIISVKGSASNYLEVPLKPTLSNWGAEITDSKSYENFEGPGNHNYDKNLIYSKSRWDSITKYLNFNGKKLGFSIAKDITAVPSAGITDTGGCTDETRDIKIYKNPGQYALIRGEYSVSPTEIGKKKITNCINKLKVVVGYFKENKLIDNIPVGVQTGHTCDFATFDVYCNNTFLATVNLNNNTELFKNTPLAKIGAEDSTNTYCSIDYHAPTEKGATVYTVLALTDIGVKKIIEKSDSGKLEFTMTGNKGALTKKGTVHGDAPWVLVYNDSDKRVLYNKVPNSTGNPFVALNTIFNLGEFSACPAIAKK